MFSNLILEGFIFESLSSARKKFLNSEQLTQKEFDDLVNVDPTKTKKYLDKICVWFLQGRKLDELEEYIPLYDVLCNKNLITQKDLNSFKTWPDFTAVVDRNRNVTSKTELKNKLKEDVEVVLDNERFLIVKPLTMEASQIYGAGTRWCTAGKEDNMFDNYRNEHNVTLYYILDKSRTPYVAINKRTGTGDVLYKIAVAVYPVIKGEEIFDEFSGSWQVYDSKDKRIKVKYVTDELNLSADIFVPFTFNSRIDRVLPNIKSRATLNPDGTWDVKGDVDISSLGLSNLGEFPMRFGTITGNFFCQSNKLKDLTNFPKKVMRNIWCDFNQLKTLKGCQEEVFGDFSCRDNNLPDLKHGPKKVGGNYNCHKNNITSFRWLPEVIPGFLNLSDNDIKSLKYIPKKIGNYLDLMYNEKKFTRTEIKTLCNVKGKIFL